MKTTNKKVGVHALLWLVFIAMIILIVIMHQGRVHPILFRRIIVGVGLFYLNYSVLMPRYFFRKRRLAYVSLSALALLVVLFFPVWFDGRPLGSLFVRMRFLYSLFINLFFFVGGLALAVYEKMTDNAKREQQIMVERKQAELLYLKNQVNPHFLFNTLNNIYALTVKQSPSAPEAVMRLSQMMRYMLYQSEAARVPLNDELNYLNDYVALQQLRMADPEAVDFQVVGDVTSKRLAPLLLIAFVENAFKYGTNATVDDPIRLTIEALDDSIRFESYNPIDQSKRQHSNGVGLDNVRKRLVLSYANQHQLKITDQGTHYHVVLTLNESTND